MRKSITLPLSLLIAVFVAIGCFSGGLLPAGHARQLPANGAVQVQRATPTRVALTPTATTTRVWIPGIRKFGHFMPRHRMRGALRAHKPLRAGTIWPQPASLPNGYTAVVNSQVPIDGNDTLGDCGEAMVCHFDTVLQVQATGIPSTFDVAALETQYEQVSGGDNGLDEDEVTSQIWAAPTGIAGATPSGAVIYDHLDITTDPATVTGAIASQGGVCMAFSVPDKWINSFDPSNPNVVWDAPAIPNPMNGHFVPLVGTLANGNYVLLTWGGSVQITPAALQICQADLFTVFSPRAYNPRTGLDFAGRTYEANAIFWASMGGSASLPPSPFGPTPPAPPVPPVPPPSPTPAPLAAGTYTVSGTLTLTPATPTTAGGK